MTFSNIVMWTWLTCTILIFISCTSEQEHITSQCNDTFTQTKFLKDNCVNYIDECTHDIVIPKLRYNNFEKILARENERIKRQDTLIVKQDSIIVSLRAKLDVLNTIILNRDTLN